VHLITFQGSSGAAVSVPRRGLQFVPKLLYADQTALNSLTHDGGSGVETGRGSAQRP
jgi:hypothetical protein